MAKAQRKSIKSTRAKKASSPPKATKALHKVRFSNEIRAYRFARN
jgi:hypothetical protein